MFSGKRQLPVEAGSNESGFYSPSYGLPAAFFFYFMTGMLGGDKLARAQIMYFALMDERPPDDEIERAYLAIRKDLLGEYGRPRGALTHERLARGISAIANARLETSRLNSDFVVRSASRRRSSYINPPIAVGYGDRKRDPISLPFDRD